MKRVMLVVILAAIGVLTAVVPARAQAPDVSLVQPGDTLSGIATALGMSTARLRKQTACQSTRGSSKAGACPFPPGSLAGTGSRIGLEPLFKTPQGRNSTTTSCASRIPAAATASPAPMNG